jgi:hypothetical protein
VPGQCWSLHLPSEYDQLLAQEHVFPYKFLLAERQIHGRTQDHTIVVGLRLLTNMLLGYLTERIYALLRNACPDWPTFGQALSDDLLAGG